MDFIIHKIVSLIICSLLVILIIEITSSCALSKMPKNVTVPATIIFGDSIVDPGNNNYIGTIVKCDFPPYGRDFMGGNPTGRFSNGKVPSDLLAEAFGGKELLPPYMDPNLQLEDLLTGVSFASGGSGYDPLTSKIASVLSLSDQLDMFKEYIDRIKAGVGGERTATIVSESIYTLCVGSDDIANTYFSTPFRKTHYDINSYTDLMISYGSTFLQGLYKMGARKIGVISLPPIGCVPSQRTLSGGLGRGCSGQANEAAILFNSKLTTLITSLNKKLPGVKLVYVDIFYVLNNIIQNYDQYGFEVSTRGCCGTGNIEVSILCNPVTPHTCPDASKYVFWDSYHPTEKAYKFIIPQVVDKYVNTFF